MMREVIAVLAGATVVMMLIFSFTRYAQGKAEGYNEGYHQALKEFRIGHIE